MIGPHATVEKAVQLPEGVQLGQRLPLSSLNPEFFEPIYVSSRKQVFVFGPIGGRSDMVTAVFGQGPEHNETYIYTGCYGGTLAMFEDAVLARKVDTDPNKTQYAAAIAMLKALIAAPHRWW